MKTFYDPADYVGIPHAVTYDVCFWNGCEDISFATPEEALAEYNKHDVTNPQNAIWETICDDDGGVLNERVIHP